MQIKEKQSFQSSNKNKVTIREKNCLEFVTERPPFPVLIGRFVVDLISSFCLSIKFNVFINFFSSFSSFRDVVIFRAISIVHARKMCRKSRNIDLELDLVDIIRIYVNCLLAMRLFDNRKSHDISVIVHYL